MSTLTQISRNLKSSHEEMIDEFITDTEKFINSNHTLSAFQQEFIIGHINNLLSLVVYCRADQVKSLRKLKQQLL